MEPELLTPQARVIITLSHAIVNEDTTFLPGRISLATSSQETSISVIPATSTTPLLEAPSESTTQAVISAQPESSSSSTPSIIVTSTPPSAEQPEPLSTSIETPTLEEAQSTTSIIESISSLLEIPTTAQAAISATSAVLEASEAPGQMEKGEKAEKEPVATVPPPNDRGVAVGIAFGAFAGFSVAIASAVLIYKLRRKRKPTGIKQFQ